MTEQLPLRDWIRRMEADIARLDQLWKSSVDDIKATIKSEVSELKTEQLADVRRRIEDGYRRLEAYEIRMQKMELEQTRWQTSAGVVNWLVKAAFALGGIIATVLGYEVFNHRP